jgi:predicted DNA-binding protein YlxM (UPF0122 family)
MNNNEVILLLDFYESLLTDKQIEIMKYHYEDDLSLSEIAENLDVSRSAVSDLIKRTLNQLTQYEDKLKLVANYRKRAMIYEEMLKLNDSRITKLVDALKESE